MSATVTVHGSVCESLKHTRETRDKVNDKPKDGNDQDEDNEEEHSCFEINKKTL